ncbi:sigma-70 family RNA polymerase sigma factor [Clostridium sp.]|uniref:sigma-70 family RNA polymerase sigma factor n=1 Tax=Clostridium sp. TaxID=1506 RepID=UPI003F80E1BC
MDYKRIDYLVSKANEKDTDSILELFNLYSPFLNNFLNSINIDSYDINDLKQECYLVLINCLRKYNYNFPFTSYYIKSCKNRIYSLIKFNKEIAIDHYDFIEDTKEFEDFCIHKLDVFKLKEALKTLSIEDKLIIEDYFFNNMSLIDMSIKYDLKYITLVKRKDRILRKLKTNF